MKQSVLLTLLAVIMAGCGNVPLIVHGMNAQEIQAISDFELCHASNTLAETRGRRYPTIEHEIARRGLTCGPNTVQVAEATDLATESAMTPAPAEGAETRALRNVNMRAGPGTNHRIVGLLRTGEQITVLAVSGSWCECMTSGGQRVYVSCNYLSVPLGGWAAIGGTAEPMTTSMDASSRTSGGAIVGTWELVGERCCGDNSLSGSWTPVPSADRERVTFRSNGRFVSTNPGNSQGRWSIREDAIEGWLSYSVGIEVTDDTMIVYHQPTSSQNAYAHQWRRVPDAQPAPEAATISLAKGRTSGRWTYARSGAVLLDGHPLQLGSFRHQDVNEITLYISRDGRFTAIILKDMDGQNQLRIIDNETRTVAFDGRNQSRRNAHETWVTPVDVTWSPDSRYAFVLEAYEGQGFIVFDTHARRQVAGHHLFGRDAPPGGECLNSTSWNYAGGLQWLPSGVDFTVDEFGGVTGLNCYGDPQQRLGQLIISTEFGSPDSVLNIRRTSR